MCNYRGAADGKRENQLIKHSVGANPCDGVGTWWPQLFPSSLSNWHSALGVWEQPQAVPFPQLTEAELWTLHKLNLTTMNTPRMGPPCRNPSRASQSSEAAALPNHLQTEPQAPTGAPAMPQEICSTTANKLTDLFLGIVFCLFKHPN